MTSPELKPCPFCGGPAILRDFGIDRRTGVRDIRVGCYVAFTARGDFGDAHDRCQVCPMIEQTVYPGVDIVAAWNRRNEMKNPELVAAELDAAKKKHPKFVDHFTWTTCKTFAPELDSRRARLEVSRKQSNVMFQDILECEMYEALDAYAHGDLAHARQELAQCAAVCLRAMEYIEKEMEETK